MTQNSLEVGFDRSALVAAVPIVPVAPTPGHGVCHPDGKTREYRRSHQPVEDAFYGSEEMLQIVKPEPASILS
jgi:1-acyl-sn-glycerol-3-phosphate acyltransferase